jgi:hypothetical protein
MQGREFDVVPPDCRIPPLGLRPDASGRLGLRCGFAANDSQSFALSL